mmetsp:Transcript_13395/g.20894  ORF Transcript_13395/g.20894 Transcript_13395/m.20894 type:complete len:85 (-) Transcript_13395:1002-1256(-)
MSLEPLLQKIPGGPRVQVLVGSAVLLGICAVPVFAKPQEKRGHDLFSQEKPEAVVQSKERLQQEFYQQKQQQQQQQALIMKIMM